MSLNRKFNFNQTSYLAGRWFKRGFLLSLKSLPAKASRSHALTAQQAQKGQVLARVFRPTCKRLRLTSALPMAYTAA